MREQAQARSRLEVALSLGVGLALGVGVVRAAQVVMLGEDDSRRLLQQCAETGGTAFAQARRYNSSQRGSLGVVATLSSVASAACNSVAAAARSPAMPFAA